MDKRLFTPGPLNTSPSVKQAMLRDFGSRDEEFIHIVQEIRDSLLKLASVSKEEGYEAIPMQGSGTFGIEAVLSSVIPRDGRLLVVVNGAYGRRMVEMAERLGIAVEALEFPENQTPKIDEVRKAMSSSIGLTHVAMVHCETTTGILNPLSEIGSHVREAGCTFIVDAMSSFGALPIDLKGNHIDFLISSANKCLEGVPGISFVLARRKALESSQGSARSLSLDLLAQWEGLESSGQFRFTPPTHVMLALYQALIELREEGGPIGRLKRYSANHEALMQGMLKLGFHPYLDPAIQSPIITSFLYPKSDRFQFADFYRALSDKGYVIYPGKLTEVDCFRIGNIGSLNPLDMEGLVRAIGETMS